MSFIERQQQPILILDTTRCKRNITRMAERAKQSNCIFRPHFKTHQSHTVGQWIRKAGVSGITVSSVSMAKYFVEDGWDDITIAFPFFRKQIPGLQEIEQKSGLRLFVNSADDLKILDNELSNPFEFVIEIDPGSGRSGISYKKTGVIEELIHTSNGLDKPQFHGFYIHDGRTYNARSEQEIKDIINPTIDILINLKTKFPDASISLGDTPSAGKSDRLHELDEITPGNFVFYDYMQVNIGSCSLDDVALFVVLPVGQIFPAEDRAILHGGAVHLSKEFIEKNEIKTFGQSVKFSTGPDISETDGLFLTALSQEHGTLNGLPTPDATHVWICPVHSCLTANLHPGYYTIDGKMLQKRILS